MKKMKPSTCTAPKTRAYGIVDGNGEVRACFTTSDTGRFIPADQPVNFTVEYASVVAYGYINLIENGIPIRSLS